MDACSGESNSQHVLLCGDIVWGGNAVQVTHVAEREIKKVSQQVLFRAVVKQMTSVYITSSHDCVKLK